MSNSNTTPTPETTTTPTPEPNPEPGEELTANRAVAACPALQQNSTTEVQGQL